MSEDTLKTSRTNESGRLASKVEVGVVAVTNGRDVNIGTTAIVRLTLSDMYAGTCSSCGTTAFSGTNSVRRHGHASRVLCPIGKRATLLSKSSRRSSRLSVDAIGGGGKLRVILSFSLCFHEPCSNGNTLAAGKEDDKKMLTREEEPEQ